MKIEEAARIFHEPDCEGLIISHHSRQLRCSECGKIVGSVEPAVLAAIVEMLAKLPSEAPR